MDARQGDDDSAHAQEGGTQGENRVLDRSEELLLNMAKTLDLMNKQSKKLSSVTGTVSKLEKEMQSLKRPLSQEVTTDKNKKQRVEHTTAGTSTAQNSCILPSTSQQDQDSEGDKEQDDQIDEMDALLDENEDDEQLEDIEQDDLLTELDNFFEEQSQTGEKVSEKMATVINRSLRTPVEEKKYKELKESYKRPENIDNLQVPTIDNFIWRQLPREVRSIDVQLQKSVGQMSSCLVPLIQALEHIQTNKTVDRNVLKSLIGDTFKMMAHTTATNNKIRKDKIQNALMPKFKNIVSNSTPSATSLFGDKIKEEIKALNEKSVSVTAASSNARPSFLQRRGGYNQYNNLNKSRNTPPFKAYQGKPRNQWQDRQNNFNKRPNFKKGQGNNNRK